MPCFVRLFSRCQILISLFCCIIIACLCLLPAVISAAEASQTPPGWFIKEEYLTGQSGSSGPSGSHNPVPRYCAGGFIAETGGLGTETASEGTLDIRAEEVYKDDDRSGFRGKVLIVDGETQLKTELALYHQPDNHLELPDGFELAGYSLIAEGQKLNYYAGNASFLAENLRFSLPSLHAWGEAEVLFAQSVPNVIGDKEDKHDRIRMENARLSFCDPTEDSWHLEARRIDLDQKSKQGRARGLKLFAGKTPVLALPYLQFPLGGARQSGLLYPSINIDSRNGFTYSQPFYINIRPNVDTTFYTHAISERGFLLEQELRWLTRAGNGIVGYAYLPHDALTGTERSAGHLHFDSSLRRGWSNSILMSSVSDPNYFRDLPSFFDSTNDLTLPGLTEFRYDGKNIRWALGVRNDESLLKETGGNDIASATATTNATHLLPYRQLPFMRFSYRGNLGYGFSWFQNTEYILFREDEDVANDPANDQRNTPPTEVYTGKNSRFFNELALGWSYARQGGFLRTAVRLEDIRYDFDKEANIAPLTNNVAAAGVSFADEASRSGIDFDGKLVFSAPSPVCDCYVTFEPRLYALYANRQVKQSATADSSPANSPVVRFDTVKREPGYDTLFNYRHYLGGDLLASEQRLVIGMESRLINPAGSEEYRLRLARAAYLTKRELAFGEEGAEDKFSPWVFDLAWLPTSAGYLEMGLVQQHGTLQRRHLTGHLTGKRFDTSFAYYGREEGFDEQQAAEQLELAFVRQTGSKWSVFGAARYDIERSIQQNLLAGIAYENCCIRVVSGLYEERIVGEYETGLALRFVFKPWGDIGVGQRLKIETDQIYNSIVYGINR